MARFRPGAAFVPPQPPLANVVPPVPTAALAGLGGVVLTVKVADFGTAAASALDRAIRSAIQFSARGLPSLTPRGGGAGGEGAGATGLAALLGPVGAVVAAATAATAAIRKAVSLASPGTIERFDLALADATAVVGQRLVPVFEVLTAGVRLVGDFFQTILPPAQEFRAALAPISDALKDLRDALASIAPVIRNILVAEIKTLGEAIRVTLVPIRLLAGFLEGLFGKGKALETSVGAAVRNVSFQSAESFAKQVNIAAFKSGIGTGGDPIVGISDNVSKAVDELKKIGGFVSNILSILPGGKGKGGLGPLGPLAPSIDLGLKLFGKGKGGADVPGGGTTGWQNAFAASIAGGIKEGFKDVQLPGGKEGEGIAEVDEGRKRGIDGFA
jgi:hypothetical protein